MYQSLQRPGQQQESAQKPQPSYREQLRAQMRDNYAQNRSEKQSKASVQETPSRREAARFDTDYTPNLRAQQRGRFGSAGPQPAQSDLRREAAPAGPQQAPRRTTAAEKTPSEARSRTGSPTSRRPLHRTSEAAGRHLRTRRRPVPLADQVGEGPVPQVRVDHALAGRTHLRQLHQQAHDRRPQNPNQRRAPQRPRSPPAPHRARQGPARTRRSRTAPEERTVQKRSHCSLGRVQKTQAAAERRYQPLTQRKSATKRPCARS